MESALSLESHKALPANLLSRLSEHRALFLKHEYLESVFENSSVRHIAEELEQFLKGQRIHGYHCTKEPSAGYFQAKGLRVTNVAAHQSEFLLNFKEEFLLNEIAAIETAWRGHFDKSQTDGRNGLIWALLSRSSVGIDGTELFFRYFGGEALFKPLAGCDFYSAIVAKLEKLGRAVVVEVAMPGGALTARYEMHKCVLSRYHASIRPGAHIYRSEASIRQAVPPSDIIQVTPLSDFKESVAK